MCTEPASHRCHSGSLVRNMAGDVDVLIQPQVLNISVCMEPDLACSLRTLGHLGTLAVVSVQRKIECPAHLLQKSGVPGAPLRF